MDYDGDSSGHVHDRYSHRTGPDTDGRRPRPHPPNYYPTSQAYDVGINVGDDSDPEPPADYDMDEAEDNPLNGHVLTPYDPQDGKPLVGQDLHSVSLEMHDMTDNGTARNHPGTLTRGDHRLFTLRHRRDASRNGYEYFKQLKQQISRGFEDDVDGQSVGSLHFEDLREARQFLATIRVRRKKSSAKRNSAADTVEVLLPGDESPGGGDEEDDAYEEVGLPS